MRTAAGRSAARRPPSSSASRTPSGRLPPRECDEAVRRTDGRRRCRRQRGRPRAARERRLVPAEPSRAAGDHLCREPRVARAQRIARDPPGRTVTADRRALSTRAFLAATLLLFTFLTGVMTYPQVLHMMDGVHDDGDPLMVTWVLAWVAHQLPRAPAHLFDANIFYPERNALAFSETLIVPGVIVAPLHWLGVGSILIHNLVFLSGFAISGVGVALLVRRLTGNAGAAILAGIVFAFPPYRIDHYAHLQLQQTQFIPLALWAFHRLLDTGRLRDGVLLGVFVTGQLLSCMYYGLFLIPYMAVVCGAMLTADRRMSRERL